LGYSLISTTTINSGGWKDEPHRSPIIHDIRRESEEYLQAQNILQRFDHYPYCGNTRIGRVSRDKYKCYGCRKKGEPRRGSILEGLRVPLVQVLIAINLFELDTSVREAANLFGLSYNTVYNLFDLFRQSVRTDSDIAFTLSGKIGMDELYFGGRRKGNRGRGAAGKNPRVRYPGAR
jgi:transposase-like protein